MGLLQDVLFGDYIARKRREHAVAAAEAMRPEAEFKANVERETDRARFNASVEADIRRLKEIDAIKRAGLGQDTEEEVAIINRLGANPAFAGTTFGQRVSQNRASSALGKEREGYYSGYSQSAENRGRGLGAAEDLSNIGTIAESYGNNPWRFDLGRAKGQAGIASANATTAESLGRTELAPVATAEQIARAREGTATAPVVGEADRAKANAARIEAELNASRGQFTQDYLLGDELKSMLAMNKAGLAKAQATENAANTVYGNLDNVGKAVLLNGRPLEQGNVVPGAAYSGPSEDMVTVVDPITKLPKQVPVRRSGTPTSTLRQRVLTPDSGNATPPPPLDWGGKVRPGIGKLPTEGITPVEKPSIDPIEKLQKKEEARLSDVSNWKRSDWLRLAKKSYGLGNIIELNPDRVIVELKKAMSHELSTGRDFVTGAPIPAEVLSQVKQQFEQLQKVQ